VVKVDARDIESAPNVEPVGWTDYALVTKEEYLATCQRIDPT
jgi:hypothetical protein